MNDAKMDWFKLYSEARNDAKLRALPDEQFRVWFNLLCYAGEQEERGTIPPIPVRLLAAEAASGDRELLDATIESLLELQMIERSEEGAITFRAWQKRQRRKPSDQPEAVAARVAKHRAARRQPPQEAPVTPRNANVTPPETETEREVFITTPPDDDNARASGGALRQEPCRRRRGEAQRSAGSANPTALAETLLREADADPARQHWRAALSALEAQAGPESPGPWRLRVLRNWLDGDGAPPLPGIGAGCESPRRRLTAIDQRQADLEARQAQKLAARLERVAQGLPPDDPPLSILSLPVPAAARMLEA